MRISGIIIAFLILITAAVSIYIARAIIKDRAVIAKVEKIAA